MNGGAKNEQRTCGAVKKEPIPHSEMYDYNFYEQMDSLMVNLLVDLAINMVRVLYATVRYVLMQPIRLVEYIWYCIQIERECDREETIRFENLKRTGHI